VKREPPRQCLDDDTNELVARRLTFHHLPIAILAELSPTFGDRVVGLYGRPLTAINQARLANSSLKPDLIEVIAKDTANEYRG